MSIIHKKFYPKAMMRTRASPTVSESGGQRLEASITQSENAYHLRAATRNASKMPVIVAGTSPLLR
jgi:hypothetical protein